MQLIKDSVFPAISASKIGEGTFTIPDDCAKEWNVVILYRGHW